MSIINVCGRVAVAEPTLLPEKGLPIPDKDHSAMPVDNAPSPAMRAALDLVDEHDTWQALRAALERDGLAAAIGSSGIERVLNAWAGARRVAP